MKTYSKKNSTVVVKYISLVSSVQHSADYSSFSFDIYTTAPCYPLTLSFSTPEEAQAERDKLLKLIEEEA